MKKMFSAFIVVLCFTSLVFPADRKRVAILNFDFGTVSRWWGGSWDIGKGIADLVDPAMVHGGTYRVTERKALDAIVAEQNLSNSNRADPSSAARIGKILGVNVILVGSITQFGFEDKKLNVGGIAGKFGGFGGGKV